jgi:hypothetical protein
MMNSRPTVNTNGARMNMASSAARFGVEAMK